MMKRELQGIDLKRSLHGTAAACCAAQQGPLWLQPRVLAVIYVSPTHSMCCVHIHALM
jgi:hypothetical protein